MVISMATAVMHVRCVCGARGSREQRCIWPTLGEVTDFLVQISRVWVNMHSVFAHNEIIVELWG